MLLQLIILLTIATRLEGLCMFSNVAATNNITYYCYKTRRVVFSNFAAMNDIFYYFYFYSISYYLVSHRMHVILNGEPFRKWIVLSTWGRKWQLMENVKGMRYTE